MATRNVDVAVVGTGPGGYVAAIRCAQLGLSVAAVEDDRPGGVCLNWGCIPTKALLRNAEIVGLFQRAEEFGVTVGKWTADYAKAVQRSRRVADRMAKGVEFLFRKNKITLVPGTGTLKARNVVEVKGKDGAQTLEAKAIILATGSEPRSLPGVTIDEKQVISSNGAVRIEATPASLIVIGAGAVGMEFADVYGAYGVPVTVLEALPRVLPIEDEEVSALLARVFSRRGMTIRTGVRVQKVSPGKAGLTVEIEAEGKAVALGETEGFLKVVADKRTGEILGVHIVGSEATEMIHEFAVGRTLEATLEEIIHTIHAHPTLSEAALEATLAALGQAIHI